MGVRRTGVVGLSEESLYQDCSLAGLNTVGDSVNGPSYDDGPSARETGEVARRGREVSAPGLSSAERVGSNTR
jgi:hypothetical protein